MRQLMVGLSLVVVTGTLLGITGQTTAVEVTFPDVNLEAEVRSALSIPNDPITDTDMERLEQLAAGSSNITNIEGLDYGTNLTWLSLHSNQISDISAVSGLTNLTLLNLGNNQISDISAVSELTSLTKLKLYTNQISDISAVSGLTNLTGLLLSGNNITDISAVSRLNNLTGLSLYRNRISNISVVSGLTNLTYLDLGRNQISDISAVSGLKNLTDLTLDNTQISDISAVSGLTNLTRLTLAANNISDISAVSGLTSLTWLACGYNQIEILNLNDSEFTSLELIDLRANPITRVKLVNAVFNHSSFCALMTGGSTSYIGVAELDGVINLDMSNIDFTDIPDLSTMYIMDDLETLSLARAINLHGSKVVTLTNELDSLNLLDVTGLWDTFDMDSQTALNAWDAIPGNTLIVPEPSGITLLCGLISMLCWYSRRLLRFNL